MDSQMHVACAQLQAFADNVRALPEVDDQHVDAYHQILDGFAQLGHAVAPFRIPPDWLQPQVTSVPIRVPGAPPPAPPSYSRRRYVDGALFRSRVEAALAALCAHDAPRRPLGFARPPSSA